MLLQDGTELQNYVDHSFPRYGLLPSLDFIHIIIRSLLRVFLECEIGAITMLYGLLLIILSVKTVSCSMPYVYLSSLSFSNEFTHKEQLEI